MLIALGSTSVPQYYSFLGPQNKKFKNEKNTPRYLLKEQVYQISFSQNQKFLGSVGCPKVFRHTDIVRSSSTEVENSV